MENRSVNQSEMLSRIVRAVILIIVSLILSVVAVSFAVHHMRLQFESEFKGISDTKIQQVSDIVKMTIKGDEIIADSSSAAVKYSEVLGLMLAPTSSEKVTTASYGLFLYSEGQLTMILSHGADSEDSFAGTGRDISEWMSADNSSATIEGDNFESVLVPVADSTGRCVAVFEYKCSFKDLTDLGNDIEGRILSAVIISVCCGIVLFIIQLFIPRIIKMSSKGGQRL